MHIKRQLNSAVNRLRGILDEYFPEYERVFKDVLGRASMWVLRHCPFPEDLAACDAVGLAVCLKQETSNRVGMKRVSKLLEAASSSVGVKVGVEGARKKLSSCLDEVEFYRGQLEAVEARMIQMLEKLPEAELLMSIPGVGPVIAATVLGEAGDLRRFKNWKQLRKLTGFNLVEQSSGQKKGRSTISKRGRPGPRHILYLAALVAVAKNEEFRALYQGLTTRQPNPLKGKQALVAVAGKMLRIMFALVKSRQRYSADKVLRRPAHEVAMKVAA